MHSLYRFQSTAGTRGELYEILEGRACAENEIKKHTFFTDKVEEEK